MDKQVRHIILPALNPFLFAIVALSPVEVLGCRLRGLIAVSIALAGALLGLTTVSKGLIDRIKGRPASGWWIASTLILALPAVYIVLFES